MHSSSGAKGWSVCATLAMEIPRLRLTASLEAIEASIHSSFRALGCNRPTERQEEIIKGLLSSKDVLVILPTGRGKSTCMCFVALSLVFDYLRSLRHRLT